MNQTKISGFVFSIRISWFCRFFQTEQTVNRKKSGFRTAPKKQGFYSKINCSQMKLLYFVNWHINGAGRHGILIFSCLLFVLFEKICPIKSWFLPVIFQITESWLKPVCFHSTTMAIFYIYLPIYIYILSILRQIHGFYFSLIFLALAYIKKIHTPSQTSLTCSETARALSRLDTIFSDLAQSYNAN